MSGNVVGEGADDVSVERGAIGVPKLLNEKSMDAGLGTPFPPEPTERAQEELPAPTSCAAFRKAG